jgi:hypothetical protein
MCYLPSTIRHFEPTATHNFGSVPVKLEGCEDARFKQRAVIEFLTAEKIPPIEIHRRMQTVYGDKCVDVSTVSVGYGRLSKKEWGTKWFREKENVFLKDGIQNLVKFWLNCIEV